MNTFFRISRYILICFIACCMLSSCRKDEMTLEEIYDAIQYSNHDRIKKKGYKSITTASYLGGIWDNDTVTNGRLYSCYTQEYDRDGYDICTLKYTLNGNGILYVNTIDSVISRDNKKRILERRAISIDSIGQPTGFSEYWDYEYDDVTKVAILNFKRKYSDNSEVHRRTVYKLNKYGQIDYDANDQYDIPIGKTSNVPDREEGRSISRYNDRGDITFSCSIIIFPDGSITTSRYTRYDYIYY